MSLSSVPPQPQAKNHYPYITRVLLELFAAGSLPNVVTVQVEPVYGYAGRIVYRDGAVRLGVCGSMVMRLLAQRV